MKYFFLFFTLFLILIAGCTQDGAATNGGTTTISSSKGVSAVNFTSDFTTLRINEVTTLRLLLQNQGDFEATNITTVLYGEGLLERPNENNFTSSLLPGKQDLHVWSLKVPLELSKTESTNYNLNARLFYNYNFSGFRQAGFVAPDYAGGDLPLSGGVSDSPLSVSISVRNPVRTLYEEGTVFTLTIVVTNYGRGNVDYFNCSVLNTPQCRKEGYLNELRLSVPSDWGEVTDLSAWEEEVDEDNLETIYVLNYDLLEGEYDSLSCTTKTDDAECNLISEALNHLRMIRGNEARIVLQFSKGLVDESIIDVIKVSGDFGYEVDTSDFTSPTRLRVLGD
ncbi:hypothetical protein GF352_02130 [archaeon]|nr:hypothetical protein [archaeon]